MRTANTINGAFHTPSAFDAGDDVTGAFARCPAPVGQDFCFTINCQCSVSSRVMRLFRRCGPSQVAFLVMPVIIDSVETMLWRRTKADRLNKIFKAGKAKFNATTSVFVKAAILRINTTLSGLSIDRIFTFIRMAVRPKLTRVDFSTEATTGQNGAISQRCAANRFNNTALTSTQPQGKSLFITSQITKYRESVIHAARHVNELFIVYRQRLQIVSFHVSTPFLII